MNVNRQTELESKIHDLLAGGLDDTQRCDLLRRIARDDATRRLLGEMAEVQWQGRSCLGLDLDGQAIESSLARTLAALKAGPDSPATMGRIEGRPRNSGRKHSSWPWVLASVAASLVMAVSIVLAYLAGAGRHNDQLPGPSIANQASNPVVLPEIKAEDLDALRRTWAQVGQEGGNTRPWVLMSNTTGEFGYLPIGSQEPGEQGLMLVRCIIVSEGQPPTQLNLLLPRRQSAELSVPGGGRLASQPLDLAVSTSAGQVHIGVRAGGTAAEQFGLEGTVVPGQTAVDVGQFRLGGRMFTVFMEARSLAG